MFSLKMLCAGGPRFVLAQPLNWMHYFDIDNGVAMVDVLLKLEIIIHHA